MAEKVRIGVIGAGGIADGVHLPSLSEIENCEVVAICDLYEEKAKNMAEKYGIPATYVSYHEMLKKEKMDAVFCLVNPDCMFRVAKDCMKAGFHVMIEKPLGILPYQAHSLVRTAEETGRTAAVALNRRQIPLIQEVMKRMKAVTEITQIDSRFMKYCDVSKAWSYASAYTCDIIHAIDLMRYVAGSEPKAAGTVIGKFHSPVDNAWSSVVEFENGIVGTLRSNYQSAARFHDLEIHGPNASAFVNLGFADERCEATIMYNGGKMIYSAASTGVGEFKVEHIDGIELAGGREYYQYYGYKSEDENFVDCIQNGTKPLCTVEDAAKSMDMIQFLLRNQVNGCSVTG